MKQPDIAGQEDRYRPVYSISAAAKLVGTSVQNLRVYEKHGFVHPLIGVRKRHYSAADIRLLRCVRELVHIRKLSIEAIKKLFGYAPCWEIKQCPEDVRLGCLGPRDKNNSRAPQKQQTECEVLCE